MPPSYAPLQVDPNFIAQAYAQPTTTFNDVLKQQAALRAQELVTQNQDIQTQQNQIKFDQENAIRQGVKDQFANTNDFDPREGLNIAKRIALQEGDYNSALDIQRSQNTQSQYYQPMSEAQRALASKEIGYDLPPDISPGFLQQLSTLRKGNTYEQSLANTEENRDFTRNSWIPGGYEANVDPTTGQGPSKKDGELFTKTVVAHTRIQNNLDQLLQSLSVDSGNDPTSPEFIKQKALLADVQIALKEKNNFGAALTGNEQMMQNALLPQILARQDAGIGESLIASGLGRDPSEVVRNLKEMLNQDLGAQSFTYKIKPKGISANDSLVPPSGPPANILMRQGQQQGNTLPRNPDGTPLTREQFMALQSQGN